MPKLTLPPHLLNEIESGNVVLFLGAGASREARNSRNERPPLAKELAGLIARKFLNDKYATFPLNQVAALAESASDLFTFQRFLADTFSGFLPTDSHLKLATFRWRGIATTNYDTILEDAYQAASKKTASVQKLIPFIDHNDRPDDLVVDQSSVLYIKLHGCITRITNKACPLIITTEQYNSHEEGRKRLFGRLYDWGAQRTILFAGYSLQDANLLNLIQKLHRDEPNLCRSFLLSPGVDSFQQTYWEKFRITAIAGTFDDLVACLDQHINPLFLGIRSSSEAGNLAIRDKFIRPHVNLSYNTAQFLERDVDYVKSVVPQERIDPKQFYKGVTSEWSAIEQNLDVNRHLADAILMEHVLSDDSTGSDQRKFIVIKAHAGSGKTVLLQRLAWDASRVHDKLCLKIRPGGVIDSTAILDLLDQTRERIYLFVDNILERRSEIVSLYGSRTGIGSRLTIIGVARTHEWNTAPESLTSLATHVHKLEYLSHNEIDLLLTKLEENDALGTLKALSPAERRQAFTERADRQILVALHEATLGKPFEEIIRNEYYSIAPALAQSIYLAVCMLYRFGAPVRAGIISRMYGVPFEEFDTKFFRPLEQIIDVQKDAKSQDMCYMARHPHIADIVVSTVLSHKDDLFHEVLRAVRYLNPTYNSDRVAFKRLVNGRNLLETFTDHQMIIQIFDAAAAVSGEDADLLQQKSIYEMNRPNGDLDVAESLINKAISLSTRTRALLHTQAELFVRRAEATTQRLARKDFFKRAIALCESLKGFKDNAYAYYTLTKIRTLQLKDELGSVSPDDDQIHSLTRMAEKVLQEGISKHPNNPHLRVAESTLANVLADHSRAIGALEKSFELNPSGSLIALRLADSYARKGNGTHAAEILKTALAAKTSDLRLHAQYAKILIDFELGTDDEIIYHLRKGFGSNDNNLESRMLLGRQLFISGKLEESEAVFNELRTHFMPFKIRERLQYQLKELYRGDIKYFEATYIVIRRNGDSAKIFCDRNKIKRRVWDTLRRGCRVKFNVAFCMNGPRAYNLFTDEDT